MSLRDIFKRAVNVNNCRVDNSGPLPIFRLTLTNLDKEELDFLETQTVEQLKALKFSLNCKQNRPYQGRTIWMMESLNIIDDTKITFVG